MSNIPENLYYTKEHEWALVEGDTAIIGITDFAQEQLTDIVYVEVPETGTQLKKDSTFGVVESVKSVSDIFSPLTGEVIAANNEVIDAPELINQDPYGKGWLVKIKMEDKSELDSLLNAKEYEDITEQE
jgi:glycine cleavage system H protein